MTVSETTGPLRSYAEGIRVLVNGYDDLFARQVRVVAIMLNNRMHDWEGQHGRAHETRGDAAESATTRTLSSCIGWASRAFCTRQ